MAPDAEITITGGVSQYRFLIINYLRLKHLRSKLECWRFNTVYTAFAMIDHSY